MPKKKKNQPRARKNRWVKQKKTAGEPATKIPRGEGIPTRAEEVGDVEHKKVTPSTQEV